MQPNLVHRVVVVGVSAAGVVVVVAAVVVVEFVARPFVGNHLGTFLLFHFEEFRCRNFLFTTRSRNSKRRLVFFIRNGIENNPLDS